MIAAYIELDPDHLFGAIRDSTIATEKLCNLLGPQGPLTPSTVVVTNVGRPNRAVVVAFGSGTRSMATYEHGTEGPATFKLGYSTVHEILVTVPIGVSARRWVELVAVGAPEPSSPSSPLELYISIELTLDLVFQHRRSTVPSPLGDGTTVPGPVVQYLALLPRFRRVVGLDEWLDAESRSTIGDLIAGRLEEIPIDVSGVSEQLSMVGMSIINAGMTISANPLDPEDSNKTILIALEADKYYGPRSPIDAYVLPTSDRINWTYFCNRFQRPFLAPNRLSDSDDAVRLALSADVVEAGLQAEMRGRLAKSSKLEIDSVVVGITSDPVTAAPLVSVQIDGNTGDEPGCYCPDDIVRSAFDFFVMDRGLSSAKMDFKLDLSIRLGILETFRMSLDGGLSVSTSDDICCNINLSTLGFIGGAATGSPWVLLQPFIDLYMFGQTAFFGSDKLSNVFTAITNEKIVAALADDSKKNKTECAKTGPYSFHCERDFSGAKKLLEVVEKLAGVAVKPSPLRMSGRWLFFGAQIDAVPRLNALRGNISEARWQIGLCVDKAKDLAASFIWQLSVDGVLHSICDVVVYGRHAELVATYIDWWPSGYSPRAISRGFANSRSQFATAGLANNALTSWTLSLDIPYEKLAADESLSALDRYPKWDTFVLIVTTAGCSVARIRIPAIPLDMSREVEKLRSGTGWKNPCRTASAPIGAPGHPGGVEELGSKLVKELGEVSPSFSGVGGGRRVNGLADQIRLFGRGSSVVTRRQS